MVIFELLRREMHTVVIIYLIILMIWGLVAAIAFILAIWRARREDIEKKVAPSLFVRDIFHFLLGLTCLVLLLTNAIGSIAALIVTAVLIFGFEYGLVLSRKLQS